VKWELLLWWTLVNSLGSLLVWFGQRAVGFAVFVLPGGFLFGALNGALQWIVLRRVLPGAGWWWILATAVGWSMEWSGVHLSGIAIGILQWVVLRRSVQRSYWWIVATIAGQVLALQVLEAVVHTTGWWAGMDEGLALSGATNGIITGIALVWLVATTDGKCTTDDQKPKTNE
jgi:hypothetical protein